MFFNQNKLNFNNYNHNEGLGLNICTINTHFFFGDNEDLKIEKLSNMNCDIYLLSEVRKSGKNYKLSNSFVVNKLERYFPNYHIVKDGEFAIISRYPIKESRLSKHEGYQFAEVDINGESISLYNTHMILTLKNPLKKQFYNNHNKTRNAFKIKVNQFEELRNDYLSNSNKNIVVSGDFNSFYEDWAIKVIKKDLIALDHSGMNSFINTFPSIFPFFKMDYSFVSKNLAPETSNYKLVNNHLLSDHSIQIYSLGLI